MRLAFVFLVMGVGLVSGPLLADNKGTGIIHVDLRGFHVTTGTLNCSLYDSATGFPDGGKPVQDVTGTFSESTAVCDFHGIKPGTYAISVFHDEDNDGKMKTGLFGIPKEGIGISNDAKGFLGPATFGDAKFNFDGTKSEMVINMQYF